MSDDDKRKHEPSLHLDMPFEEALARFVQTNPAQVEPAAGKKAKKKRAKLKMMASRAKSLPPRLPKHKP